jgi:hypothetical protein
MGFRDSIVAGITLIRRAIQSEGFVSGSTGWMVERDGDAEFNDVIIRGELQAGDDPTVIIGERQTVWYGATAPGIFFDDPDGSDEGFIIAEAVGVNGEGYIWLAAPRGNGGAGVDNQWGIIIRNEEAGGGIDFTSRSGDPTVDASFDHMHVVATGVDSYMKCLNGKYIPARIATTRESSGNSANITTTETVVLSVTCPRVESGYKYRITVKIFVDTSVSGDDARVRIREDNASGTILDQFNFDIPNNALVQLINLQAEYTAPSDIVSKVFVATLQRTAGTGNIIRYSPASTDPCFIYVDFIEGA